MIILHQNFPVISDRKTLLTPQRILVFIVSGRRACAGEALARMELYIFFASWLKHFQIKLATDDDVADLDGLHLGVFMPKYFQVRMIERT